jgi:hypothetical protein
MLEQNSDLFYFFEFVPAFIHWSLLWKDFSCFRRLILSLGWKSNDRGGLKFWTCLYATVLLAVKYSAKLNKYILLVRVFAKNTGFEDNQMSLAAKAARDICLSSQPVFFANNPH